MFGFNLGYFELFGKGEGKFGFRFDLMESLLFKEEKLFEN